MFAVCVENPRSDGRKTVVDGVKSIHTAQRIGNSASNSDKQIRAPQIVSRSTHARVQFSQFQTCCFRREEFLFTNP